MYFAHLQELELHCNKIIGDDRVEAFCDEEGISTNDLNLFGDLTFMPHPKKLAITVGLELPGFSIREILTTMANPKRPALHKNSKKRVVQKSLAYCHCQIFDRSNCKSGVLHWK